MPDKEKILIVEDEEVIMMGLRENLAVAGYEVLEATTGTEGLEKGIKQRPDLILLDLMLPGMSGYEVCRELRDKGMHMPVIMLTARQEDFDKLHGFEMGADDYVTKPFSVEELLARVHANLMRGERRKDQSENFEFGNFILDMASRLLKKKNGSKVEDITLTKTEFDLLAYFCANEGKALSRDTVMNDVWGMEYYGTQRSLDSFVAALRHKIETDSSKPKHILTVHGVGYKFAS
ncbi:MAG: response regulator transcription factor [Kiritimatiellia bacterium]|jgi:DNA-binding response OmpR family regulator|nr:response regulator transcription factor [Kiritimatiellia bacterium]MDP6810116.1 response regulator transcription factor [Kiritimatiellia bacterium]MDP7023666.1 response regulator transcription factor [Kiritimatiellia bacterium]